MNREEIDGMIGLFPEYENLLFCRGFLITDDESITADDLQKKWEVKLLGKYRIWHDDKLPLYICGNLFMLGHAYNPNDMEFHEETLLKTLAERRGTDFWKYEANLTGRYVMGKLDENGVLRHWSDCAGMLVSYYGTVKGKYYVTSHVNTIAEKLELTENPYITRLKTSRYFKLFGNVLPGDCSPFCELRRTVPNHTYASTGLCERFFPLEPIRECTSEEEYRQTLHEASELLQKTMLLCSRKWPGAAISLTGGMDSGVTFAAANGIHDRFQYFSYVSKPEEEVDAKAAKEICRNHNLMHGTIYIPENNEDIEDYECLRALISYNGGNVGMLRSNEIRKRSILIHDTDINVEIKSWVDEITRAYWHKKYGKKRFPKRPTGRYLAVLYKIFLENRLLLKQTGRVFDDYIKKYITDKDIQRMGDWLTLWSWEFGHSAGEGQHMTDEQALGFEVTVPFNNRRLISLMLKPKLQDRIADRLQRDIISQCNPKQAKMNIHVVNAAHTGKRALLERLYLEINARLPF